MPYGTPASVGAGVARKVGRPVRYASTYARRPAVPAPRRKGVLRRVATGTWGALVLGAVGGVIGGPIGVAIGSTIGALGGAADD